MNYRMLGMYRRPMNLIEKLSVGWRHLKDLRWEWCIFESDAMDLTDFVRFKLDISDYDDVDVDEVLK